jgi:hypothetical protein
VSVPLLLPRAVATTGPWSPSGRRKRHGNVRSSLAFDAHQLLLSRQSQTPASVRSSPINGSLLMTHISIFDTASETQGRPPGHCAAGTFVPWSTLLTPMLNGSHPAKTAPLVGQDHLDRCAPLHAELRVLDWPGRAVSEAPRAMFRCRIGNEPLLVGRIGVTDGYANPPSALQTQRMVLRLSNSTAARPCSIATKQMTVHEPHSMSSAPTVDARSAGS